MPRTKLSERYYNPSTLFGQFLNSELQRREMYLQDFAAYLGIDRPALVRFLTTDSQPSIDTLLCISEHMGVSFLMLVVLARPDSAPMIVQQQHQKVNDVEQRLLASGILPTAMEDMIKSTLTREIEEQLYDSLMVIDNALYVITHSDRADHEEMAKICERNIQKILNILGLQR